MRGSPLVKTLLVAVAVCLIGVALRGHISSGVETAQVANLRRNGDEGNDASRSEKIPFELLLSARAMRVVLRQGALVIEEKIGEDGGAIIELRGELTGEDETIFLQVEWLEKGHAPRYFAKLRIDPPQRDALVHVFESTGDIDDLWEMP